jgi:hypothetical protein
MRQAAFNDIGEDFHIAMTVRSKAFARRDAVLFLKRAALENCCAPDWNSFRRKTFDSC